MRVYVRLAGFWIVGIQLITKMVTNMAPKSYCKMRNMLWNIYKAHTSTWISGGVSVSASQIVLTKILQLPNICALCGSGILPTWGTVWEQHVSNQPQAECECVLWVYQEAPCWAFWVITLRDIKCQLQSRFLPKTPHFQRNRFFFNSVNVYEMCVLSSKWYIMTVLWWNTSLLVNASSDMAPDSCASSSNSFGTNGVLPVRKLQRLEASTSVAKGFVLLLESFRISREMHFIQNFGGKSHFNASSVPRM